MSFIENRDTKIEGNMYTGGNIKITCLFNIAPDSVNITIEDPNGYDQVDEVAMTAVASTDNRVWEYTYQSLETHTYGIYDIFIRAINGDNISFQYLSMELLDGDDD